MAILDRFRTQARHKHPDATVRLAFVQELPLDERDLLVEIAREDAEPRVRRAAVAKLMDPVALGAVARDDGDEQVRAQAVSMLRDIAVEAFEGVGEPEGHAAVDALADPKTLIGIAKNASRESTALRAVERITDVHALASIARHADHESVRLRAFDALQDHAELLKTALNCEFRDPTLAAVERITDRVELELLAARAKNKSAAKRARAIVREMDDRIAAERDARQAAEAAAAADAAAAAAEEAARAARASEQARAEEEAAARQTRERDEAERRAADEAAAAGLREEQEAAERARADAAAEAKHLEAERRSARLAELAAEAAAAAAIEDLAAARRQFNVVRKEWNALGAAGEIDAAVAAQYAEADRAFAARDTAAREADERARRDALTRLQQVAARVEAIAARTDLTLKSGERALKELRGTLAAVPQLPSKRDYEEIVKRFKAVQTALTPKVQELRDIADWQRWANVGIQEQLCEKMEALKALDDPEQIAKQVRELQQQWRQAADVPRAQGETLWKRFKTAHDEVWAKCESHFAEQNVARGENLAKKIALCERAESLAESTNWIRTADEIKALQAEWKTIGPVTRGQEKAVWERFRAACDRFFTRRHADLAERKKVWAENLVRKEALIVAAEALQDSTDWDSAATEIKRLQGEWKTIGPVKKSRSEALWLRFRAACDHFFSRYAQRHDIAKGERAAAREAIVAELEALAPEASVSGSGPSDQPATAPAEGDSPSAPPPADLVARVRGIRGRWQSELAARGVDRDRAAQLDARFTAAFARLVAVYPAAFAGTDLDPDTNRKRMETIVQRMEDLAKSLGGPSGAAADASLSPTTRLAAMLKEALAANTIGGRVDDDSRFRAATEDVRQAQASWSRIGPVPDETRRALADRFQRAIRRISDAAAAQARGSAAAVGSGRPH
jgi:uncharacterized protein DUF349